MTSSGRESSFRVDGPIASKRTPRCERTQIAIAIRQRFRLLSNRARGNSLAFNPSVDALSTVAESNERVTANSECMVRRLVASEK